MDFDLNIARQAGQRWEEHRGSREEKAEKIKGGRAVEAESPERVQARLDRLEKNVAREQVRAVEAAAAAKSIVSSPVRASALIGTAGFERILGKPDLLNVNFLELALAISRYTGRINIKLNRSQTVGFGTGFMVSPRLIITNNHVLPSLQDAMFSEIEFDFQFDRFGHLLPVVNFAFEPQTFFMTSAELDFTLVAVSPRSVNNDVDLNTYGWNRLIKAEGKALIGDSLNIIQHPRGQAKQIAIRSNRLLDLLDEGFAHYETDTEPGSSGSGVYNDQWEVVALHHSGVPKRENGQLIAIDGSIWRDGIDDPDRLAWVANEGIRISRIVSFIEQQNLTGELSALRRDLLEKEPPNPLIAAMRAGEAGGRTVSVSGGNRSDALNVDGNSINFTIPLHISVRLGTPSGGGAGAGDQPAGPAVDLQGQTGAAAGAPVPPVPDQIDSAELRSALAVLAEASTRPYYDETADTAARDSYYQGLNFDQLSPVELFDELNRLLDSTHVRELNYKPAVHLYPWVDLRESGSGFIIQSIYSERQFSPQELIEADFRTEMERERLSSTLMRESTFGALELQRQVDLLEASMPFNCEHVVPQSWFAKKEPMRGDLHHLFACEVGCNSFRSNIPYFDFPDFEEVIRDACGKRDGNRFEPINGKGAVARATLYFLLRHPRFINATSSEYTADRIPNLVNWHNSVPVSRYEKHRNAAIHESQGNRNPLIDFPELADRIDFTRGLG